MSIVIGISGGTPYKKSIILSGPGRKIETEVASPDQIKKLQKRADLFDHILRTNWTEDLPSKFKGCSQKTQWLISELKTRFITNADLSEHKLDTLIKLILSYEQNIVTQRNTSSLSFVQSRLYDFLYIQVYTRWVEFQVEDRFENARAISRKWNDKLATDRRDELAIARVNIIATADFIRDVDSLIALGFKAPQLWDISRAIHAHSNIQFDETILNKYRSAVRGALLAFYFWDNYYLENFRVSKDAVPNAIVMKWGSTIPIRSENLDRHSDDVAKDYSLAAYPEEVVGALSDYTRSVVYDLTRQSAPRKRKSVFSFQRKPDWNRITREQNRLLGELKVVR